LNKLKEQLAKEQEKTKELTEKLDKQQGLRIVRSLKKPESLPKGWVLCNEVLYEKNNLKDPVKITVENVKMPNMAEVEAFNSQTKNTLKELIVIKKY